MTQFICRCKTVAEFYYSLRLDVQPVIRLEGKLCVFPGIPGLFQKMIDGLTPYLPLPPPEERPFRQQVFTSYVLQYRNGRHKPFD